MAYTLAGYPYIYPEPANTYTYTYTRMGGVMWMEPMPPDAAHELDQLNEESGFDSAHCVGARVKQ